MTLNYDVDILTERFPEYRASPNYYDEENRDLPYVMLGNLCLMAFEGIDERPDHELAERLVTFVDEIFNDGSSDPRVLDLFAIEVLETLTASRTGANLAKKCLHGRSLGLLEHTLKHYHTDTFLHEYRRKP